MKRSRNLQSNPSICLSILDKLVNDGQNACYFLEPVDLLDVPYYSTIIHHPMDFDTIRKSLRDDPDGYAGENFARDVRRVFQNALLFNPPQTDIYQAALKLSDVFEVDWSKFSEDPSLFCSGTATSFAPKRTKFFTIKIPSAKGREEKIGVFRDRVSGIHEFIRILSSNGSLEAATKETMKYWAVIPEGYASENITHECNMIFCALEDNVAYETLLEWLKQVLVSPSKDGALTMYKVTAMMVVKENAFASVDDLLLTSPLLENQQLWQDILVHMMDVASSERILSLLQRFVKLLPSYHFETMMSMFDSAEREQCWVALERFVKWSLAGHVVSDFGIVMGALNTGLSKVAGLRNTLLSIATDTLVQRSPDPRTSQYLIKLCYSQNMASSKLIQSLLEAGQVEKAKSVVSFLLEWSQQKQTVVSRILHECSDALVHTKNTEDKVFVDTLHQVMPTLRSFSERQMKAVMSPLLHVAENSKRHRFADLLCSAFLSTAKQDFKSVSSALLLIAWTPNVVSPSVISNATLSLSQLMGAGKASEQEVQVLVFGLSFCPKRGFLQWKEDREKILKAAFNAFPGVRKEAERMEKWKIHSAMLSTDE